MSQLRRRLLRAAAIAGTVAAIAATLYMSRSTFAQVAGLGHPRPGWLLLALVAEVLALAAYAQLVRVLLRAAGVAAGLGGLLRATVGGIAMNASLPAGQGVSTVYWYKELRRQGAEPAVAGVALSASTLAGVGSMGGLMVAGVALAGDTGPLASARVWIVGGGVLLIAARFVFQRQLMRGFNWVLQHLAHTAASIDANWRTVGAVTGSAYANWLLDCACLWLCLVAVHAHVSVRSLLLVYVLAQLVAAIPLLPGGGGTVEVSLTLGFAAFGYDDAAVVTGAILYRLVSCWGLIPIGWFLVATGHQHHHSIRWRWRELRDSHKRRVLTAD